MSVRGLALLAGTLGLVLVAAALLWAKRLGHLGADEGVRDFVFTNRMIEAERGRQVRLRPIIQGGEETRFWVATTIREPDPDDPLFAAPHVRVGTSIRRPPSERFSFRGPQFFALSQLGALSNKEWLEDIQPVRERQEDGSYRHLLRARFGHDSGGRVAYFFDPERPVPMLGWFRTEMYPTEGTPQVHFAFADGMRLP